MRRRAPQPRPAFGAPTHTQLRSRERGSSQLHQLHQAVGNRALSSFIASNAEREADAIADRVAQPAVARDDGALPPGLRLALERILGGNFGGVRVHSDRDAAVRTAARGARAMAEGPDLYFAEGAYRPDTADGARLVAHEAVHVAQQGLAGPTRGVSAQSPGRFLKPADVPHYPTKSEQEELADILGFHGEAEVTQQGAAPKFVDKGEALDREKVIKRADQLFPFYKRTIETHEMARKMPETVHDAAEALDYVKRARDAVQKTFGSYLDHTIEPTIDATTTSKERGDKHQVLVSPGVADDAASALANSLIGSCTECTDAVKPLNTASKIAVKARLVYLAMANLDLKKHLKDVAEAGGVGGEYEPSEFKLDLPRFGSDPYKAAVHEVIHAFTHPAFREAFRSRTDVKEGITEHFAEAIRGSYAAYQKETAVVDKLLGAMGDDFDSPEESLRLAYFKGRLDLIGWVPSTDQERDDVQNAGGVGYTATPWARPTAELKDKERTGRALAMQNPHLNVFGVGFYFQTASSGMLSMRYARIVHRSERARFQVAVEGELDGTPTRLGGGIGLGIEYQKPWFYLGAGVRVIGSGALSRPIDGRLDVSPYVGGGVRLWQRVRVGVDGFALIPVLGDEKATTQWGIGGRVGLEFK